MPLTKPPLVNVSPGQPVTAQAWNAVLAAIGALYDAVIGLAGDSVEVSVNGGAVTNASVVAVPTAGGAPVAAVPPRGGGATYTLTHLTAGAWTVHVKAAGFQDAQVPLTVPATTSPLAITLTATTKPMPDLLGQTAQTAVQMLTTAGVQLGSILDVQGVAVAKPLPAERNNAKVLFQFPDPGEQVVAATANTRLVLSALPTSNVKMPNLIGKTYAQAEAELEALGLKITKVNISSF